MITFGNMIPILYNDMRNNEIDFLSNTENFDLIKNITSVAKVSGKMLSFIVRSF